VRPATGSSLVLPAHRGRLQQLTGTLRQPELPGWS
jgi:hypothetical protein